MIQIILFFIMLAAAFYIGMVVCFDAYNSREKKAGFIVAIILTTVLAFFAEIPGNWYSLDWGWSENILTAFGAIVAGFVIGLIFLILIFFKPIRGMIKLLRDCLKSMR